MDRVFAGISGGFVRSTSPQVVCSMKYLTFLVVSVTPIANPVCLLQVFFSLFLNCGKHSWLWLYGITVCFSWTLLSPVHLIVVRRHDYTSIYDLQMSLIRWQIIYWLSFIWLFCFINQFNVEDVSFNRVDGFQASSPPSVLIFSLFFWRLEYQFFIDLFCLLYLLKYGCFCSIAAVEEINATLTDLMNSMKTTPSIAVVNVATNTTVSTATVTMLSTISAVTTANTTTSTTTKLPALITSLTSAIEVEGNAKNVSRVVSVSSSENSSLTHGSSGT